MENLLFLGVPILKHIRVLDFITFNWYLDFVLRVPVDILFFWVSQNHIGGLNLTLSSVLPRLGFCAIFTQILKMTQPKLSPQDIWRTLIFSLSQDFEPGSCVENSHAKNNFVLHRNSRSCNDCFD